MFKYIKSFLGIVIFVLIVAINIALIIGIVFLSTSISLWFLLGEIITIPLFIFVFTTLCLSERFSWLRELIFSAFK